MDGGSTEQWSIPVERFPGPTCRYAFETDTPVLRALDSAFESQFDVVEAGTPVAEAFDSLGFERDIEDLAPLLGEGGQFTITAPGDAESGVDRRYAVQVIAPAEEGGTLVFTEIPEQRATPGVLGVDHVASVVSHDLRNPLDVARARLQAGRELDEDTHFDHVAQAHERMERIIQDVLTLARGEEVVEPDEPVDLGTVAEAAWETVETNGASLTIADPLPTAIADPDRVGRLFENLFRNAVEHGSTNSGSDTRQAAQEHRSDDRQDAKAHDGVDVTLGRLEDGFYVADDGPGIPEADRDRVFSPGYSSDDHGTGLGLAIVARIVDLHGWSRAVTTAEGGGTRIEISGVDPVDA
jgi:signal transduction histidine kinase